MNDEQVTEYELADAKGRPEPVAYVICYRDPDSSNEFSVHGAPVETIDVDYGRSDLRDRDEFEEWAESHMSHAGELFLRGTEAAVLAAAALVEAVAEARENYGHAELVELTELGRAYAKSIADTSIVARVALDRGEAWPGEHRGLAIRTMNQEAASAARGDG
jgi:hypothetical protein